MKKRRLGRSGLVVSEIGLGTMTFGSMADEPTSVAILDKAVDAGVDFLDVAMSDFKTNEYATLIGGRHFEPHEENPMIGWRGASRYYDKDYMEGFALECLAFKKVRDEMGLTNMR